MSAPPSGEVAGLWSRLRGNALVGAARRWRSRPLVGEGGEGDAELERRQHFTDALLETIEVGIVSCDANGVLVVNNRAERELFGLEVGFGGQPMDSLEERIDVLELDGRSLGADEYPLMRALRGEEVSRLDVLAGPAGGPHRELVVRGRQITDEHGRVLGAVAALTDVTAERVATRELAAEHRRLNEAQRLGQLGSFEYDFSTDTWAFSDHLAVLWGLDPDEVDLERLSEHAAGDGWAAAASAWQSVCRDGGTASLELRIRRSNDGADRLIKVNVEVELGPDGRPAQGRGTHLDVTDLDAAERAAQEANTFLHAILAATPDLTIVADVVTSKVIYRSPGKGVLGLTDTELASLDFDAALVLVHPDDEARLREATLAAAKLADGEVLQVQYRCRHADGRWRWLSRRMTPFRRNDATKVVETLAVVRDVTDVVDAELRLVHAARHDYLTGLPNRALLVERLETALGRCDRDRPEIAVLFCDLDGFKEVNDAGGHAVGDAVLVETARRLVTAVRDADLVARVGGDEFVVVVEPRDREELWEEPGPANVSVRQLAVRIAERVTEAIGRPVTIEGDDYLVTASIGIAYASLEEVDGAAPVTADAVMHDADTAMYRAKELGGDQFRVFDVADGRDRAPGGGGTKARSHRRRSAPAQAAPER